jgi:hypothetical protein
LSYDFECYLFKKPWFSPKTESGNGWQILIDGPLKFQAEDIQDSLIDQIGSRRFLIRVHMEGELSEIVDAKVNRLLSKLVAKNNAVVLDLQNDTIWDRTGQSQLIINKQTSINTNSNEKIITLSFYFDNEKPFGKIQKRRFFELMEKVAPKALPRRYGDYEPMSFNLKEHGKEHFLKEWEKSSFFFWRGTAPFQWAFNSLKDFDKNHKNVWDTYHGQYSCSRLEFQISSNVLKTKKELSKLLEFQAEASNLLKVFYSEITLGEAQGSPLWRGLPKRIALSSCLGTPYIELWPEFLVDSKRFTKNLYMRDSLLSKHAMLPPTKELNQTYDPS